MTRVRALQISTIGFLMLAAGCGVASYEHRLEEQVNDLKYKQKLDNNLITAPTDPYKTLLIYVRPPKPMSKAPSFLFQTPPPLWDVADTYVGSPPPDKAPTATDPGSPTYPPIRLHLLGRIKKKPAAGKKKAECAGRARSRPRQIRRRRPHAPGRRIWRRSAGGRQGRH